MRVLYFTRAWTNHDERFLRAFRRHHVEIGILSLRDHGMLQVSLGGGQSLGHLGLAVSAGSGELKQVVEDYRRVVKRFAPDVIVAGPILDCGFVAAQAATSVPWVAQSWAFDVLWENEENEDARARAHFALQHSRAIFADCKAVLTRCSEINGRLPPLHFVMPWGLDAQAAPPETDPPSMDIREVGDLRKKFIYTRGFEPLYCPEFLLKSWQQFVIEGGNAVLWLAADGSLRKSMEDFVLRHKLSGSVRFLGRLPHARLAGVFAGADFYVSCAASDGTSVSLLEAMGAGLPAIVNDRGGNGEWIKHGENGWKVPFGDSAALAQSIHDAVSSAPSTIRKISLANRQVVAKRADWNANFPHYLSFLEKAAGFRANGSGPAHA